MHARNTSAARASPTPARPSAARPPRADVAALIERPEPQQSDRAGGPKAVKTTPGRQTAGPPVAAQVGDPTGSVLDALRKLYPYAKPMAPRFALGVLSALGSSIMALTIPQVLQWLVNGPVLNGGHASTLWWAAAAVLGLGILEAVLIASRRWWVMGPGTRLEAQLRNRLFRHLTQLPVGFHRSWGGGQLLSRSMTDLGMLRRWLCFSLVMLIVNTLTIVIGVLLMVRSSWELGLLYLAAAIPVVILSYHLRKSYRLVSRQTQDQAGDLATVIEESVHGIRVLKAFGRGGHALDKFAGQASTLRDTEIRKARALSRISLIMSLIPEVVLGIALVLGVSLVVRGELSIGAIVAFFATAAVIAGPLDRLGAVFAMTLDAKVAVDRYFDVLGTRNDIADPEHPIEPAEPHGEITFDHVSFHYDDATVGARDLLADVDLTVRPGETLALIGATGAGKSTLVQLIPRLFDVTGGAIRIDGVDIRDMTRKRLRQLVSIAFEDPVLFSDTVRANVLLGSPDAGDDVLREALSIAQADFVYDLPLGLDTVIGEEGLSLSGGQRQRLALARAVAARPQIIVLDDPLSAVDVHTEERVQEDLRRVLEDTTTIIVAHRPSTVAVADRVAVLRDGVV
ncbi:MAG: ABC transporter ATP-binding protein, partial [Propionibacteriaceae bacterium]